MQKGLYLAKELGIDVAITLFSDSYWKVEKEDRLYFYMNEVLDKNYLISVDQWLEDCF
jgi:hypothetical protein